jgi:hypothetical protein
MGIPLLFVWKKAEVNQPFKAQWCTYYLLEHSVTMYRWEDNIIMYLQEIGWEDVDWIHLFQNRI